MTVVDIVIDQPQRSQRPHDSMDAGGRTMPGAIVESLIKQQFLGFGWKTCSRRFQPLTSCKCSCVALGLRSGLDSRLLLPAQLYLPHPWGRTDYFHVIVPRERVPDVLYLLLPWSRPASMLSSVFSVTSVALFSDRELLFP